MLLLLAAALSLATRAADVVAYENDFDTYGESDFSGTDGWLSGYDDDAWSTRRGDNIYASEDEGFGEWGSGDAIDNHLVYTGDTWSDFTMDATLYVDDDDGAGFVFRYQDAENFYMVLFCGGSSCPGTGDGDGTGFVGMRLYKVESGSATELDSSSTTYSRGDVQDVQIVASGGALDIWFDDDTNGVFDADDEVLSASDSAFSDGMVGFYCYNCGEGDAGCAFDDLVVSVPVPEDLDHDGYVSTGDGGDDCDDGDASVHPDAPERLNGTDDDCDGLVDDGTDVYDDDGDGYSEDAGDCADDDASVGPGANEVADGVDNDCDGETDEVAAAGDLDGDGYTTEAGDCDDGNAATHPGATEILDGIDNDCDGLVDTGGDTGADDTDLDTNPQFKDPMTGTPGECGCAVGGAASGWSLLLGVGMLVVRRRFPSA